MGVPTAIPSHGDFAVKGFVQVFMNNILWFWIGGSEPFA
jgi:hypothetical protein